MSSWVFTRKKLWQWRLRKECSSG